MGMYEHWSFCTFLSEFQIQRLDDPEASTITGLGLNSSSLWWETPLVKMPTSSRATCIRWCNCRIFVVKWLLIPRASGSDLLALPASQERRHSGGHKQDLPVRPRCDSKWEPPTLIIHDDCVSSLLPVSRNHILFTLKTLIAEPQDATNRL